MVELKHGEYYWVKDKEASAKYAVTVAQYVSASGRPKWWLIATESPADLMEIEPIKHIERP